MNLKELESLENIQGKRVLLREDFNVPTKAGHITDDTRIREAIPTLTHLIKKGAKTIIISHLGRPDGKIVEEFRLKPVADQLSAILGKSIK